MVPKTASVVSKDSEPSSTVPSQAIHCYSFIQHLDRKIRSLDCQSSHSSTADTTGGIAAPALFVCTACGLCVYAWPVPQTALLPKSLRSGRPQAKPPFMRGTAASHISLI